MAPWRAGGPPCLLPLIHSTPLSLSRARVTLGVHVRLQSSSLPRGLSPLSPLLWLLPSPLHAPWQARHRHTPHTANLQPSRSRAHSVRPVRRTETPSIFAASLHCLTPVTLTHTTRTVKSREWQEDTSGNNDFFPNLSLYSWPKAITYNMHPFSPCLTGEK